MGFVLGILFPSLWRTFRRGFRKETKYTPFSETWKKNPNFHLRILNSNSEDTQEAKKDFAVVKIMEAFTVARYFQQLGKPRNAIQAYLEILGNQTVSQKETNSVLFELSQVYLSMKLYDRAFDTGFELLHRTPTDKDVFKLLFDICHQGRLISQVLSVLQMYTGPSEPAFRKWVCLLLCQFGEDLLQLQKNQQALEFARLATRWNPQSARALVLLWQITSQLSWDQETRDSKSMWVAFAAILDARAEIYSKTKVSPMAGAGHLAQLIAKILEQKETLSDGYSTVQPEIQNLFSLKKGSEDTEKKLLESIFCAIILLQGHTEMKVDKNLSAVFSLLCKGKYDFLLKSFFPFGKISKIEFFGFFVHQCQICKENFVQFEWVCPKCNADETLKPALSLTLE